MAENFPSLKETDIKIQEAQRALNKLNPHKPKPRHILIKNAKVKIKKGFKMQQEKNKEL